VLAVALILLQVLQCLDTKVRACPIYVVVGLFAVTRGTERLHVAARIIAAKGVHFDMVDLEALVEKCPAAHAEPLL
jgi:hypothetical protein